MSDADTDLPVDKTNVDDPERRNLALALFGAMGGAALLEACTAEGGLGPVGDMETVEQMLNTTDAATFAALRTANNPTGNNATRLVRGRAATSDGGGGIFVWTVFPTAAPLDDDLTIIKPTAQTGNGRWVRLQALANLATLKALPPPAGGTPYYQILGYYAPRDGGGGLFVWDPNSTALDNGGTIIAPNAGGTGRWIRDYSGAVNVLWFGAKVDDGTLPTPDSLDAFKNAIHCQMPATAPMFTGPTVEIPPGTYFLSNTLKIDRIVTLRGAGGGSTNPATQLRFPTGVNGLWVATYDGSTRGDMSSIQDLGLIGPGPGTGHGILMNGRATIERCYIYNFGGDGIHVRAFLSESMNANNWSIRNVVVTTCTNGLYVEGDNANAGSCINLEAHENSQWGIWDHSWLGNNYFACHVSANPTVHLNAGGYNADKPDAKCIFVGCYAEGGLPALNHFQYPSVVLGGNFGTGFDATSSALIMLNSQSVTSMTVKTPSNIGPGTTTWLGDPGGQSTAFAFKADTETLPLRLQYGQYLANWWTLGADVNTIPLAIGGYNTSNQGDIMFPPGILIGSKVNNYRIRLQTNIAPPPIAGANPGDVCFNTNAASGSPMGWIFDGTQWKALPNVP